MEQFSASSSTTARTVELRSPGPIARFFMLVTMILFGLLALIILIPILIIAIALGLIILLYLKIKSLFTRAHQPNGPLDGRHNVTVIKRDE